MGGEETEVTDGRPSVLLEAANFEPVGDPRASERLGLRTEGSNRWEKGVDPHLAEQAALATELIVELTRRALGRATPTCTARLPERPVVAPAARARRRGRRARDPARTSSARCSSGSASRSRTSGRHRARPGARATSRARSTSSRRSRASALDDVPVHAAAPPRDVRPAHARAAPAARRRGRPRRRGLTRRTRRPSSRPTRIRTRMRCRAALERAGGPADDAAAVLVDAAQQRRRRQRATSASSRSRTSTCRRRRPAARSRWRRRDRRRRLLRARRASSRRSTARCKASRAFEPARAALSTRARRRAPRPAGSASCTRRCSRATWGAFELDLATLFARRARAGRVRGRDHVPGRQAGPRVRRRRGRAAGELVEAAREAAGPELREIGAFDVYRGAQVGPGTKSIAFSVDSSRPSGRSPTRMQRELRERIVAALKRVRRRAPCAIREIRSARAPVRWSGPQRSLARSSPAAAAAAGRRCRSRRPVRAPARPRRHGRRRASRSRSTRNGQTGHAILDPGTYTVQVDDRATEHNFHLYGPGVESTTPEGTAKRRGR